MSKSGLFAHFGSKEELQLSTVRAARRVFHDGAIVPALDVEPGVERLHALLTAWFTYIDSDTFKGGCFLMEAAAEFDNRPGPVRDLVAETMGMWMDLLVEESRQAIERGERRARHRPGAARVGAARVRPRPELGPAAQRLAGRPPAGADGDRVAPAGRRHDRGRPPPALACAGWLTAPSSSSTTTRRSGACSSGRSARRATTSRRRPTAARRWRRSSARCPTLIVLDVAMPGLDGLAVARRLRAKGLARPDPAADRARRGRRSRGRARRRRRRLPRQAVRGRGADRARPRAAAPRRAQPRAARVRRPRARPVSGAGAARRPRARAHAARGRAARAAAAQRARVVTREPRWRRCGAASRRQPQRRRPLRRLPAAQARRPAADPHGPRRRLRARRHDAAGLRARVAPPRRRRSSLAVVLLGRRLPDPRRRAARALDAPARPGRPGRAARRRDAAAPDLARRAGGPPRRRRAARAGRRPAGADRRPLGALGGARAAGEGAAAPRARRPRAATPTCGSATSLRAYAAPLGELGGAGRRRRGDRRLLDRGHRRHAGDLRALVLVAALAAAALAAALAAC